MFYGAAELLWSKALYPLQFMFYAEIIRSIVVVKLYVFIGIRRSDPARIAFVFRQLFHRQLPRVEWKARDRVVSFLREDTT